MPNAARAIETLDMAQPSPQMVERSPGPSTPIGSLAHDELHCVYTGGEGRMDVRKGATGRATTQQRRNTGARSHTTIAVIVGRKA